MFLQNPSNDFWWILLCLGLFALPSAGQEIRSIVANIDQRIETHRKRDARVTFQGPDGRSIPAGTSVHVELQSHAFLFGGMIGGFDSSDDPQQNQLYRQRFADVFNYASLIFIWDEYEPQKGQTKAAARMKIAQWCQQQGMKTKGHCLFWNLEPSWLRTLPAADAERQMWMRITREVHQFRDHMNAWDVVNEATDSLYHAEAKSAQTQWNALKKYGTAGSVARALARARAADQDATLVVNDFEISARREKSLQACLDQGADMDVIGIQSHMHQGYWGAEKIWDVCERFAKFNKPLHFTELTILSGQLMSKQDNDWTSRRLDWTTTPQREKSQADQVRETYRLLFSHPAVEAITWWDLSDRYAWMGAPGGLLREDFSPKESYFVIKDHIRKGWHTKIQETANAKGEIAFRGFHGSYLARVVLDGQSYRGAFRLERDKVSRSLAKISVRLAREKTVAR